MRLILILASLFLSLLAVRSQSRGMKVGDTQIVAQWLLDESSAPKGVFALLFDGLKRMRLESRVSKACGDICFLDGNDIGSGTYNLFLFTQDVSETAKRLIDLEKAGRLPPGLRIGVARYTNSQRTDWTYEPIYPETLKQFDIFYRIRPEGLAS